jgi:hypothetical protein
VGEQNENVCVFKTVNAGKSAISCEPHQKLKSDRTHFSEDKKEQIEAFSKLLFDVSVLKILVASPAWRSLPDLSSASNFSSKMEVHWEVKVVGRM